MTETKHMHQDRELNVNWLRVNIPSVISILIVGISVAMYVQSLVSRVETMDNASITRALTTDKTLEQIQKQLNDMANVPYRVDTLERNLLQTNQRIDQSMQTLNIKIDSMSERFSTMTTKVEVMAQRLDTFLTKDKAQPPSR